MELILNADMLVHHLGGFQIYTTGQKDC